MLQINRAWDVPDIGKLACVHLGLVAFKTLNNLKQLIGSPLDF